MLLILVTVSLTALLLPTALTEAGSTRREVRRTHELHAAMAGIEAAVGQIRAAVEADGLTGKLAALPACDGTMTGGVGSGPARYQVTVYYLDLEPVGQSEQWARDNAICSSGRPATTPAYALLVAQGTDRATGAFSTVPRRTLRATYVFHTTDQPAPGGLIHGFKGSAFAPDLCLDAGSAPWVASRPITMRACVPGATRQTFAYNRDLSLLLVATRTVALPLGLCLDGGSPHVAGSPVTLQNCQSPTPARQKWSYNGSANFEGTTNGTSTDGYCLNAQIADTPGSPVLLGSSTTGDCATPGQAKQSFAPDARVGAGMANPPNTTGQFVNLQQFGRCLDIPSGRVSLGYLIAWPCKQSPDGVNVGWNQIWVPPALSAGAATCGATGTPCGKGTISVVAPTGKATPAGTYCLQSPGSVAAGQYVSAKVVCPAGTPPANMTWTVYGDTHDPLTRYHIVDYRGYCLIPSLTDLFTSGVNVGKTVLEPCAESTLQMWNAPANATDPTPLKDLSEL
jgi:hypothetical protein